MRFLCSIVYLCIYLQLVGSFQAPISKYRLKKPSKLFIPEGYTRPVNEQGQVELQELERPQRIYNVEDLKRMIAEGYRVQDLDVRGDIANLLQSSNEVHPVVKELYKRKASASTPGLRTDDKKIAISVEGGGMRGCVAAGMMTAIWYLGLQDSIDVIYGSSAGSLVAAYFITQQLPYDGPEIYYDVLTNCGDRFIDKNAIYRACGLGILDFRPQSLISLFKDRMGKPVLNLDFLFRTVVQKIKPLNWEKFWEKQVSKILPLKVIASGLFSRQSVILSAEEKNFQSPDELAECMKASMLLPGITGDAIRLRGTQAEGNNILKLRWKEYETRYRSKEIVAGEPMADAQLFEPIPYRSAMKENCTHIIALRTRADDICVTAKMSFFEKMIMWRFFGRKLELPELFSWMINQYHKLIYAEDILRLNAANRDFRPDEEIKEDGGLLPRLYGIALPAGVKEVSRTETSRAVIFQSVRDGFAAAYDSLVEDPNLRGQGQKVAKEIWPDSILDTPPKPFPSDL